MKKLLCTLVLTSTLFSPGPWMSAAQEEPPEKAPPRAAGLPFRGKISSVDLEAKTLSLAGRQIRIFQVTAETKIKRDGEPATLKEARVGDTVGGYALRGEEGHPRVVTLNIQSPEPPEE